MKACSRCRVMKPLEEFYARDGKPGGHSWCKACIAGRSRQWKQENRDRRRALDRAARRRLVERAHAHLGGRCAHCGNDDPRVLQVDHVNNDGAEDRRRRRRDDTWKHVLADTEGRFQLLCANCHAIKTYDTVAARTGN